MVKLGNNPSTTRIFNTGGPQGCVLSPLLYSLFTHDCVTTTTQQIVGLITNNDETAYREEMRALVEESQKNNLSLNINKTKENEGKMAIISRPSDC